MTTPDPLARRASRARRLRRALSGTAAALGGLAVVGGAWFYVLQLPVTDTVPPPPAAPNPNAYDFFVRAASREIGGDPATGATTSPSPGKPLAPLAARVALLERNGAALRTAREGLAHPYQPPNTRGLGDFDTNMAKFRELARCLRFAGDTARERGDLPAAADAYADAAQFGLLIGNGGNAIDRLVGIACEAIGREPLWRVVDRLDAQTARRLARRLEDAGERRRPLTETVREDGYQSRAQLLELFGRSTTFRAHTEVEGGGDTTAADRWRDRVALLTLPKRRLYADLTAYTERAAAWAESPHGMRMPSPPDHPILRAFASNTARLYATDAENRARTALVTASLALRAYAREHDGASPETLDALVSGGYLRRVPVDPFAPDGAPLRYTRTGGEGGYALSSIGQDGKGLPAGPIPRKNPPFTP